MGFLLLAATLWLLAAGTDSEAEQCAAAPAGDDSHSLLATQRAALQAHRRAREEGAGGPAGKVAAGEPLQRYRRLEQLDLAEHRFGNRSTSQTWLHKLGVSRVFGIVLRKRADNFRRFIGSLGLEVEAVDVRQAVEPPSQLQSGGARAAWEAALEGAGVVAPGQGGGRELAGSLSHALLLHEFAKNGRSSADLALVFEDDIEPIADRRALEELQRRLALVLAALRGPRAEPNATGAGWVNLGRCLDRCEMDVPVGSSGLVQSFSPVCGHAYLVTRAGARAIVESALPVRFPQVALDDAIVQNALHKGLLEGLSVTPRLFTQRKGDGSQSRLEATARIRVSELVECWQDPQADALPVPPPPT